MKHRILSTIIICIAMLAFAGCDKETGNAEDLNLVLSVQKLKVDFPKAGGKQTILVTTNADRWTAETPEGVAWLDVEQTDNAVDITVFESNETGVRSTTVTLKAGSITRTIKVSQSGN